MLKNLVLSLTFCLFAPAFGIRGCVELKGQLSCAKDPKQHHHVEVVLWDSDTFLGIDELSADEVMGLTYTNEKGEFVIYGCASDPDFMGHNRPDPYLTIRHFCNTGRGETLTVFPDYVSGKEFQRVIHLESNEVRISGRFARALRHRNQKHVELNQS
ncbi:unnamed protein product, partial [Mesorhabditis spiculigera]